MVTIKTPEDIAKLRKGGKRLAQILKTLSLEVKSGISAHELNALAEKLIREGGDTPAFLNYKPKGAKREYPSTLCVSVNNEVVHGVSNGEEKVLKEGDIVSLDLGLVHEGLYTDHAITVPVGKIDAAAERLLEVTKKALKLGIAEACAGNHVGDIGHAIEEFVRPYKYGIVRELAGHGVGYKVHEAPYVPNYGEAGQGELLRPGMVIAIEPMVNEGDASIVLDVDGFTYKTADGKRSAHFEHTVLITDKKPEILTVV